MTKSENRELLNVLKYMDHDMGLAARTLATLVRSTRSKKTKAELLGFALAYKLNRRIEFIVC
jgi:hypothetical protein